MQEKHRGQKTDPEFGTLRSRLSGVSLLSIGELLRSLLKAVCPTDGPLTASFRKDSKTSSRSPSNIPLDANSDQAYQLVVPDSLVINKNIVG